MAILWEFLMVTQIPENSFIACLAHCDVHKWSTDKSGSLDDIFPVVIGLNSPGSDTQSVTLSVSLGCIAFSVSRRVV